MYYINYVSVTLLLFKISTKYYASERPFEVLWRSMCQCNTDTMTCPTMTWCLFCTFTAHVVRKRRYYTLVHIFARNVVGEMLCLPSLHFLDNGITIVKPPVFYA